MYAIEQLTREEALDDLRQAISDVARQLSAEDWARLSEFRLACLISGPHRHFGQQFITGHRHFVDLIEIPGVRGFSSCGYYCHSCDPKGRSLFFGRDRKIYRQGRSKVYVAELEKRVFAEHIANVTRGICSILQPH